MNDRIVTAAATNLRGQMLCAKRQMPDAEAREFLMAKMTDTWEPWEQMAHPMLFPSYTSMKTATNCICTRELTKGIFLPTCNATLGYASKSLLLVHSVKENDLPAIQLWSTPV